MYQPISAAQVHECSKVHEICNNAMAYITGLQVLQKALFLFFAPFAHSGTFRHNQPPPPPVDFDDFQSERLVNHFAQAVNALSGIGVLGQGDQLGGRHKTAQAEEGDDHATFVEIGNRGLVHLTRFHHFFGFFPVLEGTGHVE